jgi:hypothetical protein
MFFDNKKQQKGWESLFNKDSPRDDIVIRPGSRKLELRELLLALDNKFQSNVFKQLPAHLVEDIYNSYFMNGKEEGYSINFDLRGKLKLLNKLTDSTINPVTNNNIVYSYILTEYTLDYIIKNLFNIKSNDDKEYQSIIKKLNDNKNIDDFLKKISNKQVKNFQKKALEQAKKIENNLSNILESGKGYSPTGIKELIRNVNLVKTINNVNIKSTDTFIKQTMNTTSNGFIHEKNTKHIPLIESDVLDLPIIGLENMLIPNFEIFIEDIVTLEESKSGKTVLYIDVSGSMFYGNMFRGIHDSQSNMFQKCLAFAIKMMTLGYVERVYFFDDELYGPFEKQIDLLKFNKGKGGTSFNLITNSVIANEQNKNVLVLTDGECHKSIPYLSNIYWMSLTQNVKFNAFRNSEIKKQYIENKRCGFYDFSQQKVVVVN